MKTILIVEDEEEDAKQLESVAKSLGDLYKLVVAKNGMEAMEKLKKANPDLVLLDMTLPGYISGRNLLFRKEIQHIPIILVSKMDEIDLKVLKVKFENVKCYITKPIDEETLKNAIDEVLSQ
jgi:CheY-like chemotaxis protein